MSIAHSYRWVCRGVESPLYRKQCSWCGARLGDVAETFVRAPDASIRTSHGICADCRVREQARHAAAIAARLPERLFQAEGARA